MAGWIQNGGMSHTAISWQELHAYNQAHYGILSPEELDIMMLMSRGYSNELHDKNPHKQAPYGYSKPKINSFAQAMKSIAIVKELKP